MLNNIKIGEGEYGNMAFRYFDHEAGAFISHNNVSYWCQEQLTNTNLKIMKNTKEGKHLTDLLQNKKDVRTIQTEYN